MPAPSSDEVLDHLAVPVVVAYADDFKIFTANPAARDLLGLAAEAARDTLLTDLFLDVGPFESCLTRLARAEPEVSTDALLRRTDGTVLPVTLSVGAAYHSGKAVVVVSFQDLTPLRQTERRLRMRAELEELVSDISIRFLAIATDDLEKPLEETLEDVAHVTLAESAMVALIADDRLSSCVAWQREPDRESAWRFWLETDAASMFHWMADSEAAVVTSHDGHPLPGAPATYSLLAIPIRTGRMLHGVMALEVTSPDRSWTRVQRTVETVARIVASVLERQTAEDRARRNGELLSGISRNVSEAVYRAEVEGDVVFLNRAFATMFGYSSVTELLSRPGAEIFDDPDERQCIREDLLRQGALRNREVRFRRADGSTFWGLLSTVVVRDEKDVPRFFDGAITDISDRKRAAEELVAERELLAVTLASIADGVLAVDEERRVILANERAGTLIGLSEHRLNGCLLEDVLHLLDPRQDGARVDLPALLTKEARIRHREAILVDASEERIWVSWSLSPRCREETTQPGHVVVLSDLTERRRTEGERLKANKLEAVGLLAGGIAHDFRNILSVIQGNASLARHMSVDPALLPELLSEIVTASRRAGDLTEQLLTFSRGGAPVKARLELAAIIEESVQLARRGSHIGFEVEIDEPLDAVEADSGQLHQVLNNLLINAKQAMPEGGVITVTAEPASSREVSDAGLGGRFVCIRVQDEGTGIEEADLARIFDPYFTTKEGGTGLGLASAYSIVKRHGGRLLVTSQPRVGTQFSILLPAASEPEVEEESSDAKPAHSRVRGQARILLVDDDEAILLAAERMMQILGLQCHSVREADAALAAYREAREDGNPFDLVLMDLTIPGGIGGSETNARLLQLDPRARVVVSSGYSNDPVMSEHKEHGFVDVLPKPYTIDDLVEVLTRVLGDSR